MSLRLCSVPMAIKTPQLILSIGLCLGAGVLGSVFTA